VQKETAGRHQTTGDDKSQPHLRIGENIAERLLDFGASALRLRKVSPTLSCARGVLRVQLIERSAWVGEDLRAVVREARELTAILGASVRTARARRAADSDPI